MQGTNVFVSYSHADASLVAPVVKLLRANKSFVFQDIDRIQPGKKWRSEIAMALTEAQLVVVFWCDHANRSDEVLKEWKAAIEQEKDLLPLLLDTTLLPPELGEFQWIDFRGTVGANHSSIKPPAPEPPGQNWAPRKSSWFSLVGLATVVIAVVSVSLFTLITLENDPQVKPPINHSLPEEGATINSIFLIVSVVLAITACVVWFLRRWSKRRKVIE